MDSDRRRWDSRYEDRGPGEPSPPAGLAGLLEIVAAGGRALDIACGLGEQSVWAAQRGFDVDALDVSPVAIDRVAALALRHSVADRVHARVHDLDTGLPDDVTGPYELVICQRFRDPRLYPVIPTLLAPGGVAVVTVLSSVGLSGQPGPFHALAGELTAAFDRHRLELLHAGEGAGEATVVVRAS